MKNFSNLGFVALLLVVLGCSCPKLNELRQGGNSSAPHAPANASSPDAPTKSSTADLTMAQYEQIKNDMKKSDVEKILGGKGTEISSSSGGGMTFTVYKWEGENYRTILVTFKNDKVMSKSQAGLK